MQEEKYNLDYSKIKTNKQKKTNFDRITESAEALASFIHSCERFGYGMLRIGNEEIPNEDLIEWLQKECEG